jgi:alpha-glucosidase (family GH31 glycosyl hydrolase)
MFADPQTLTVNAVAKNLVKIASGNGTSEYLLRTSTDEFRLNIRNTSYTDKKRLVKIDRHNIEFVHTVFPVAPSTVAIVRKTYVVVENQQGDTLTDPVYVASALLTWATSSSNANLTKLMNYES